MDEWPESVQVDFCRPAKAALESVRFSTATLHEASGGRGALPSAIKPIRSDMRVFGPSLTVSSPPGDNLWLHHALTLARPGDVLVVDCSGSYEHGYWGEIMTIAAMERQIQGLVIDGCVRDSERISLLGFPVFARGLCIRGTTKDPRQPGAINHPIDIGDIRITAGDVVVGDSDGVVVIASSDLAEVGLASRMREENEATQMKRLRGGETTAELFGFDPGALV
jgi:4-hydroxy-4-methyl-2-oxoglutarate aldolase